MTRSVRTLPRLAAHDAVPTKRLVLLAVLALLAALATRVSADPKHPSQAMEDIVRDKLTPQLAPGLDIARVYLPANLATIDADPAKVAIELPRELRAGRPSIKVIYRGRESWVPVAIAQAIDVAIAQRPLGPGDVITDDDISVERRAVDAPAAPPASLVGATVTQPIAAGAPIAARAVALPPPLPRGSLVTVDVQRGAVHIRGSAALETSARPGEQASARLAATKIVVHGRLVAPATLIVGDLP